MANSNIHSSVQAMHLPSVPFERTRCWPLFKPALKKSQISRLSSSFLGQPLTTSRGTYYPLNLTAEAFWPVSEHKVNGTPTLVGMGWIAILYSGLVEKSNNLPLKLSNLIWLKPFQPSNMKKDTLSLELNREANSANAKLTGQTLDGDWHVYAEAVTSRIQIKTVHKDLEKLKKDLIAIPFDEQDDQNGLVNVGKRWHCRKNLWISEDGFRRLAELVLPDDFKTDIEAFPVHPALLDVAVSLAIEVDGYLPAACGRVLIHAPLEPHVFALSTTHAIDSNRIQSSCKIFSTAGKLLIEFSDMIFLRLAAEEIGLHEIKWEERHNTGNESIQFTDGNILVSGIEEKISRFRNQTNLCDQTIEFIALSAENANFHELVGLIKEKSIRKLIILAGNGEESSWYTAELIKNLMHAGTKEFFQVLIVGSGVAKLASDKENVNPDAGLQAGLAASANWEDDQIAVKYLDIDSTASLSSLVNEFKSFSSDNLHSISLFRNGKYYDRQIIPLENKPGEESGINNTGHGTIVITGGQGAMGSALARAFAEWGILRIALLDLSKTDENSSEVGESSVSTLTWLQLKGIEVRQYSCDVTDKHDLGQTLDKIRSELGKITGIIHTAGVSGGGFLLRKEKEEWDRVLAPKVIGTRNLHELTQNDPVILFVLASSRTAITGAPGQTDYAAANAFLDSFAQYRRSLGLPALAIDWATWEGEGMAARSGADSQSSDTVKPEDAAGIISNSLKSERAQVVVTGRKQRPVYDTFTKQASESEIDQQFINEVTLESIGSLWKEVLGYDRVIQPEEDFFELGGDSITGMQLISRIQKETGQSVSLADLFSNSSLESFSEVLVGKSDQEHEQVSASDVKYFPILWEQAGILREASLHDTGTAFNLPLFLRLPDVINEDRLTGALNDLIKRHEILRTRFELHGESFKMIVLPSIEYSLPMEFHDTFDLDKLSLELIQPFDLSELPLFRAKLIKYKTGERVFYFDIHHSLADATSLDILMGDLAAFYQHQELPALPIQLKDLSLQRTSEEEKNKDEEARRYWLKKYQDNLPKLDLPGDYPRPNVHTYRGDVVEFEIGQELTNDLRRVARKYGTTTFNLFLTTWSILLYKYTEQTDIVIATALDERDHPDLMQMPGMLISLLPIRFEMSRSINIEDLIKRNHKSISEAIKYRGYNLIRLLSELMPPAAPERMTLMEIMFSYMNGRRGTLENSVWSDVQNLTPEKNSSKADISIFGTEFQSNITFILEYYSDLFSESRMKRMGEHLVNLLQQVVTIESTMSIASMELTNEIERRRLANFNRGFVAIPVSMTVHSLVLEQAELHPDAIALTDKNGSISYQMLAENAKRVASNLIKMNVLPGDFVAVTATRETATIISFLGIMIAGCAYLPLDTEQPENRIKLILKDANCRVLIANDPEIEKCSPSGCTMIHTDQLLIDNSCEPSAFPVASGDDPAYLIYTSGSTGVPKGVVVPHRGVYRLTKLTPEIEIFPEDCVFQGGNLAFDVSTWEIWGPLSNGARGVLVEKEELVEKSAIRNLIQKYGISVMWLTTSLGNSFAEVDPGGFAGLRMFITGGEKLSVEHIRRIHVASPDLAIYNGYGPTENTTFTSIHKVVPEDLNGTSIPIGIPIANTSVYILDSNGKSVPIGIWGELCTGGDGVAIGYWKDHELTAKRFIQNPLNPEERIYKTGDYARWREDGVLEFLGRRDGQVKLRGFRVETGEIEEKIRQIEGIHNAVVIVRQDEQEKMLAAFIVSDAKIDLDIVLEALHQKLPGYMIPARFVQVDEIPLTSNGKADRKKLISILDQKSSLVSKNARAGKLETTNEKLVAELFKELLKIDEVGPESNFMELGGHSLMIFRLINRIAEKTGQRLAIRDVMKTSSVRKLALLLENIPVTDDDKIMPVIPANSYPLSHAQQRLFMQHQLEGADSAYNMPMLFEFGEKFNPEIFRKVLNRVCERHNAFKTAFHDNDGKLNQTIQDSIILPFEVDDLRQLANPREEALRLIRNELRKPFDLAKPPLLRVRICQTGEDSYLCSLCMHHIIGDGWSVRILFSEIGELYGRFETGQDLQLETLSIQYHDYAVWQMTRNWEKASKYWQQKLETSAAKLEIPYDYPAPAQRSYRGATEQIMVSQDLYRAITRTVKARGITLATFGLGMFAAILYRLTRQDDFIIGLGIAGRERKELEGIIGFFVNLLPVRIQMTDDMEVDELLQKVHQTVQDAMELQDYPFDLLVRDINTSGSKRRDTFINIVFEYQRFEGVRSLDELPEALKTRELNDDELNAALSNTAKYDITLFMIEEKENLLVRAEYDTDLFAGKTIHDWLDAYIQFLQMASISDDEDAHS